MPVFQKKMYANMRHELINKMYDGAPDKLVASIIGNEKMDKDMIRHLKELIQNL